jgi:hypothetical protein
MAKIAMHFYLSANWLHKAGLQVASQCCFSAFRTHVPGCVATDNIARNSAKHDRPGVRRVRHKPKHSEIHASRQWAAGRRRNQERRLRRPREAPGVSTKGAHSDYAVLLAEWMVDRTGSIKLAGISTPESNASECDGLLFPRLRLRHAA